MQPSVPRAAAAACARVVRRSVVRLFAAVAFVAWLSVTADASPPVELPIIERPHEHEAALGYRPWYIPNVPGFDKFNRPYLRDRSATDPNATGFIQTLQGGRWVQRDFVAAIRAEYPTFARFRHGGGELGACITFDADDWMYTLVRIRLIDNTDRDLVVYSSNYGETFRVLEIPNDEPQGARPEGFANMEYRVGGNRLTRPPLITTLRKRADHPLGQWTAHYNMYLFQPHKADGVLKLSKPVLATDHGLYMSRHAGNPSFAVSGPDRTFFTWAETTENNYVPGAPTFAATFDPETLTISDKVFCGFAYPPNDGHNSPGIVLDPKGTLHVVTGGHGENFMYARSLAPFSTASGMSEPIATLKHGWKEFGYDRGRQSYLSFVCTSDGTLHTVFRQWYKGTEPYFLDNHFGGLSYERKLDSAPWPETSQLLIVPPLDGYSIYYQTMTIDRHDRIYLSYSYRNEKPEYGTPDGWNHYMALLMSADRGKTWCLVDTDDFVAAIEPGAPGQAKLSPATVTGVVAGPDGKPLAGASVTILATTVTSDADGKFSFSGVLADEFELAVEANGCARNVTPARLAGAGTKDLHISLEVAPPPPPALPASATPAKPSKPAP